jgi:hypothetical protein
LSEDLEGADDFSSLPASSFISRPIAEWVLPMIGRYQCRCVDLVSWFPCIVTVGISLPLDEVLKASFVAVKVVINDGLDLVFLSIFNQLRGWPHVVDPMLRCFTIRGQEGRMKDVMNGPGWG